MRLNLPEIYQWWADQNDTKVEDFDQREKDAAVAAYMDNLKKVIGANTPGKKQKRLRRPRRKDWR